jgi:hypothetical protein
MVPRDPKCLKEKRNEKGTWEKNEQISKSPINIIKTPPNAH